MHSLTSAATRRHTAPKPNLNALPSALPKCLQRQIVSLFSTKKKKKKVRCLYKESSGSKAERGSQEPFHRGHCWGQTQTHTAIWHCKYYIGSFKPNRNPTEWQVKRIPPVWEKLNGTVPRGQGGERRKTGYKQGKWPSNQPANSTPNSSQTVPWPRALGNGCWLVHF